MKKSFKLAFGLFLGVAVVGIVRLSLVGMEQGQAGPAGLVAQPAAAAVNVPRVPSLQELTVGRVAQQIADISPTLDAALAEVENLNITESQKNLVRPVLEWLYPAIATWPENREQLLGFPAPARKLFAREYYLKTRQDVGEQLGVEVGFSIAEIFVLEHFPAVVPDDGILDFMSNQSEKFRFLPT